MLAVLDPRLRTMGYGRRFLASLPPAPVTHDSTTSSVLRAESADATDAVTMPTLRAPATSRASGPS